MPSFACPFGDGGAFESAHESVRARTRTPGWSSVPDATTAAPADDVAADFLRCLAGAAGLCGELGVFPLIEGSASTGVETLAQPMSMPHLFISIYYFFV